MPVMRLDKFITIDGKRTRKDARRLIQSGRVSVGGVFVKKLDYKVDSSADTVCVDGAAVTYQTFRYLMLNKPPGVLSASTDRNRRTVIDLIPDHLYRKGLFPVGRLDKDTEGLLIITDDGEFAHRLLSPKNEINKIYEATVDGPVTIHTIRRFAMGITLADGTVCLPAGLRILAPGDTPTVEVTVCEGKYHQIKRMFGVVGLGVLTLKRKQIGQLPLDSSLPPGECRELSDYEVQLLLRAK